MQINSVTCMALCVPVYHLYSALAIAKYPTGSDLIALKMPTLSL